MRTCSGCSETKELSEFYLTKGRPDGRCKPCRRAAVRAYRLSTPEQIEHRKALRRERVEQMKTEGRSYVKDYKERHPERWALGQWRHKIKKLYGTTEAALREMYETQEGKCAICRQDIGFRAPDTHVDHINTPDGPVVRALLCRRCNMGLGHFVDDPALLRVAADYIEKHYRSTFGPIERQN